MEKEYFIVDHSGRGYKATLTESRMREVWDLGQVDDQDIDISLHDFLEIAEIGDIFYTEDNATITRVK